MNESNPTEGPIPVFTWIIETEKPGLDEMTEFEWFDRAGPLKVLERIACLKDDHRFTLVWTGYNRGAREFTAETGRKWLEEYFNGKRPSCVFPGGDQTVIALRWCRDLERELRASLEFASSLMKQSG